MSLTLRSDEVLKLVKKGAIIEVAHAEQIFISRMFLVPKKDGTHKPVIDLRMLNRYIRKEHFKMEGVHLIKALLQEGDWMVKIDLKDAYFAIPILEEHWKYLAFCWKEKTYYFRCLPFGLLSAPRNLHKDLAPSDCMAETTGMQDNNIWTTISLWRTQRRRPEHKSSS